MVCWGAGGVLEGPEESSEGSLHTTDFRVVRL